MRPRVRQLGRLDSRRSRRGVATLWTILTLPAFLLLLMFVVDAGNLWLARAELENAMEAAALAAVEEWGDAGGGATNTPRTIGVAYAGANSVVGTAVTIGTNLGVVGVGNPNANQTCTLGMAPPTGNLIFGALTSLSPVTFDAGVAPVCPALPHAVRAQATVEVSSLFCNFGMAMLGPYSVSAAATARYDCATARPALVRVDTFICP